ncbi:MAG: hypothetical protein ACI9JM_000991 [Halioglobus sp.]|jgi:hypothetical protein
MVTKGPRIINKTSCSGAGVSTARCRKLNTGAERFTTTPAQSLNCTAGFTVTTAVGRIGVFLGKYTLD